MSYLFKKGHNLNAMQSFFNCLNIILTIIAH